MADIEAQAFKRDRRFLVRLVLMLVLGTAAGVFMFAGLTGEDARGCASAFVGGSDATPSPARE